MIFEQLLQSIDEKSGIKELVSFLDAGGDINATHPVSGCTILHAACEHQNGDLINVLIKYEVQINIQDRYGQTPLHIAVDADIDSILQGSGNIGDISFNTVKLLLNVGADESIPDSKGNTPKDWAANYGKSVLNRYENIAD